MLHKVCATIHSPGTMVCLNKPFLLRRQQGNPVTIAEQDPYPKQYSSIHEARQNLGFLFCEASLGSISVPLFSNM